MAPNQEIMRVAGLLCEQTGIDVIVVDTEEKGRFTTTDRAASVASLLNADYYTIDDLKSEYLHDIVQMKKI